MSETTPLTPREYESRITILREEVNALREMIGQPPPGSHPHEYGPRAATWHAERKNWETQVRGMEGHIKQLEQQLAEARAAGAVLTLENEHLREGLLRAMRALAEPDRTDAQRNFHAYEVAEIALLECGSAPAAPEGGDE